MIDLPMMYTDLAAWWPVLSAPEDYAEEAAIFARVLMDKTGGRARDVLELGSGGGNNASHLKRIFRMTLVDASSPMLAVSRGLNPECPHIEGDMRNVRLGRAFDAVFVHDAVMYMRTREDLLAAMATALAHCREDGVALFVPDHTRETYTPGTHWGGHDRGQQAMRYLEWSHDPDPSDDTTVADYAYLLRDPDGLRARYERHELGLFARTDWLDMLRASGFHAEALPYAHSTFLEGPREMFVGRRTSASFAHP